MERKGFEKSQLQDITEVMDSCLSCKKKTKSLSKNNFYKSDRDDFYTPSALLFDNFCEDMVSRYEVDHLVSSASVTGIDVVNGSGGIQLFSISCKNGEGESSDKTITPSERCGKPRIIRAKRVVLATGNSTCIRVPEWALKPRATRPLCIQHASEVSWDANSMKRCVFTFNSSLGIPVAGSRLLVIGGGLTSAQLVKLAIKYGFEKV
jgi:hypothetical protein